MAAFCPVADEAISVSTPVGRPRSAAIEYRWRARVPAPADEQLMVLVGRTISSITERPVGARFRD